MYILIIILLQEYWVVTVWLLYKRWINMRKSWFQLYISFTLSSLLSIYMTEWQLSNYQQDSPRLNNPNTSNSRAYNTTSTKMSEAHPLFTLDLLYHSLWLHIITIVWCLHIIWEIRLRSQLSQKVFRQIVKTNSVLSPLYKVCTSFNLYNRIYSTLLSHLLLILWKLVRKCLWNERKQDPKCKSFTVTICVINYIAVSVYFI